MREITLTVRGDTVHASRHRAGIQGEANATALVVTFDESWDGYAKKITFWDALEQNPVVRGLNIAYADRTYKTTIPGEPLALAGECLLVIDGYLDGTRARTISVRLTVDEAPVADNAGEPVAPAPDQYEELRGHLEQIMENIRKAEQAADAAVTAENAANDAKQSAGNAARSEQAAAKHREAIESLGASGTLVPADSDEPLVEKQVDETGVVNLHFNIRQGREGPKGEPGDPGERGPKGEDAYAKAVEYGYEGAEEEFYLALANEQAAIDGKVNTSGDTMTGPLYYKSTSDQFLRTDNIVDWAIANLDTWTPLFSAFKMCRIQKTSYTGTGVYGEAKAKKLTFDFQPKLVIIKKKGYLSTTESGSEKSTGVNEVTMIAFYGDPVVVSSRFYGDTGYAYQTHLTWSGKTLSFWGTSETRHLNYTGHVYNVLAIG